MWCRYPSVRTSDEPVPVGWWTGCTLVTACRPRLTLVSATPTELQLPVWTATARGLVATADTADTADTVEEVLVLVPVLIFLLPDLPAFEHCT